MKFKCDRDVLSDALQTVQRAVSSRPGIPALTGVLVNASGNELVLATTDLEVSARLVLDVQVQEEGVALIPARLLGDMVKSFEQAPVQIEAEDKGTAELFVEHSQVAFRLGNLTLTSRLIEGEFPNYRQLLPERYENRLTASRQQLLDAVRRVGLLARESSPVKMEFNALGVRLSSSSPDLGGAVEVVEAKYEGDDLTAAFNPSYLVDGLTGVTGDRVEVEVRDGLKPAVFRGEGESFLYLVMPVRLPAPVG